MQTLPLPFQRQTNKNTGEADANQSNSDARIF